MQILHSRNAIPWFLTNFANNIGRAYGNNFLVISNGEYSALGSNFLFL